MQVGNPFFRPESNNARHSRDFRKRIKITDRNFAVRENLQINKIYVAEHFDIDTYYVDDGGLMVEVPRQVAQEVEVPVRRESIRG